MPHTTKHIERAVHALIAYEHDAFPGKPSLLQRDPFYAEALLAALLCDLEHYASHHGINFSDVLSTGRAINASEVAEDTPYKIGDQARLTHQHNRCGTVIGWQTISPDTETSFLVAVPGVPYVYAEPATRLAPAPDFPPTHTIVGAVHHADQAEQLYITMTTRLTDASGPIRAALEHDRKKLLAALSSWSGITETRLHDALAPRPPASRHHPAETRAVAPGVSTAISHDLPSPPPHPRSREQLPPSSATGPAPGT
ncbi:hypothetical protein [Actinomadura chokoriensis]|uniref:Uncharacterized protein n=1 Tax=Actinomadura chokoriensis TaxID=454156 RepID=A0ABV4RAI0_9ACTN